MLLLTLACPRVVEGPGLASSTYLPQLVGTSLCSFTMEGSWAIAIGDRPAIKEAVQTDRRDGLNYLIILLIASFVVVINYRRCNGASGGCFMERRLIWESSLYIDFSVRQDGLTHRLAGGELFKAFVDLIQAQSVAQQLVHRQLALWEQVNVAGHVPHWHAAAYVIAL